MNRERRTFEDRPAKRSRVPLLIGLVGPSGCGKTFSALRLATGIQRIVGGEIHCVDTEADRALHYSPPFQFRHVHFEAPFGPLDYLDAIEHSVARGASVIVVDSFSHEHEGPGGVLEQHEAEIDKLAGPCASYKERQKYAARAWIKPKAARRRLINSMVQMNTNFVLCFRAQEKLKWKTGAEPEPLGWQPIAGPAFVYEMTVRALLRPGSKGVPEWNPQVRGEHDLVKVPEQFRELFDKPQQLSEEIGEHLARWASGQDLDAPEGFEPLMKALASTSSRADLEALLPRLRRARDANTINDEEYNALRASYAERRKKR